VQALPRSYYGDDDVDYEVYVRQQVQGNDTVNDWIVQVVLGGSGNEAIFRVSFLKVEDSPSKNLLTTKKHIKMI